MYYVLKYNFTSKAKKQKVITIDFRLQQCAVSHQSIESSKEDINLLVILQWDESPSI
jgi:hypothetical protein